MSKIETLLVAQTYIKALAKLMDSVAEEDEDNRSMSLEQPNFLYLDFHFLF